MFADALSPIAQCNEQTFLPTIPGHQDCGSTIVSLFGSIRIAHGDGEQPED
jgi:hypothetical protein